MVLTLVGVSCKSLWMTALQRTSTTARTRKRCIRAPSASDAAPSFAAANASSIDTVVVTAAGFPIPVRPRANAAAWHTCTDRVELTHVD